MSSRSFGRLPALGRGVTGRIARLRGSVPVDADEQINRSPRPVMWGGDPAEPKLRRRGPFHWIGIGKDWDPEGDPDEPLNVFVSLPPSDLKTHIMVLGRTGCGKTGAIGHCIAQDILLGHSFVILDLRGDLCAIALELLTGRVPPSKVAYFDLREQQPVIGYSPLSGAGPEFVRALAFMAAIEAEHEQLGVQLSETLRNCALLLAECSEPITRLESILYDDSYRQALIERSKNLSVRDFWVRYSDMSKERKSTLAMPVLNKVSILLATPSLRTILGSSHPIDLGKHLDTPGSVTLISLAVDQVSGAGKVFGNLILASICREVFARVGIPESRRNPVRLYVDEFENFNSDLFATILAEGRKYKLSLLLAHQVLAQLSPTMRSLVLNGVGTKLVFATGRSDSELLSKDLTGDAKAIDFTDLRVGEAYLWRRSRDLMFLEVNRPLIRDTGSLSPSAKAYVERIRARWKSPDIPASCEATTAPNTDANPKKACSKHAPKLEDWI